MTHEARLLLQNAENAVAYAKRCCQQAQVEPHVVNAMTHAEQQVQLARSLAGSDRAGRVGRRW